MGFPSTKFVMAWDFDASARYLFSFWCSTMVFKNCCFCQINSPDFHKWKQNFGDSVHCVKSVLIRSLFWSIFSRIQSKYGKIRTSRNSTFGLFSRSGLKYDQPILLLVFSFDFFFHLRQYHDSMTAKFILSHKFEFQFFADRLLVIISMKLF